MLSPRQDVSLTGSHGPVFYCSKVLGLITFQVDQVKKGSDGKLQYRFGMNFGWLFYMIAIVVVYVVCYGLCITQNQNSYEVLKHFPSITIVGHFLIIALGFFSCCIIYAYCLFNFKSFEMIFNTIQSIDDDLNKITGRETVNYVKIYRTQNVMIISGVILYVLIIIFDGFIFVDLVQSSVGFMLVSYSFPYVCSAAVQLQFITGVNDIYQRFKLVNKFLYNISTANKPTSKAVTKFSSAVQPTPPNPNEISPLNDLKTDVDAPPAYIKFDKLQSGKEPSWTPSPKNVSQVTLGPRQDPPSRGTTDAIFFTKNKNVENMQNEDIEGKIYRKLHLKLNDIFILHDKICDIAEVINDTFAVQLVACITSSFIITLFGFFFETKVIFFAWGTNFRLIFIATSFTVWGIASVSVIYIILRYCTAAREEAAESALIIHKILQNKPAFMLNDEIYYSKMKSFTLQVLHRKNTFHFNGLGLFRLDYTFIFSVVSAATSYLIVLLQFDLSQDLEKAVEGFRASQLGDPTSLTINSTLPK